MSETVVQTRVIRALRVPMRPFLFRTEAGGEPVRDWLGSLPARDRKAIGGDIRLVEFGWPVGMPLVKPMGGGLHEVRTSLPSRRIARVLAWQIGQAMKQRRLSKSAMAVRMRTSRSQLERVLDPAKDAVSLESLVRAASAVGKRLRVELEDPA